MHRPLSPPRVVWFWAKVVLVLAALDHALFATGWFWRWPIRTAPAEMTTREIHRVCSRIFEARGGCPPAVIVGSSIVGRGVRTGRIERELRARGVDTPVLSLGVDGARASEDVLVAHASLEARPWMVLLGFAARAFLHTGDRPPALGRVFYDSSIELVSAPRSGFEQQVAARLRRYWLLYRYRLLVRASLRTLGEDLLARLGPRSAGASAAPLLPLPRSRFPPEEQSSRRFHRFQAWLSSRSWRDYERFLGPRLLRLYARNRFGANDVRPGENRMLADLRGLLGELRRAGVRALVAYFPENPVFRRPEAARYFDPAGSDELARVLARLADRSGAHFVDLRGILPPEDFYDLVHVNRVGAARLSDRLAAEIEREWRAGANMAR